MGTTFTSTVIVLGSYRIVSLLVGLAFGFMGYRLFYHGVFDKAGELLAAWGDRRLALKQAAPGTFFSVLGAIIVVVSLWRGIGLDISLEEGRISAGNLSDSRAAGDGGSKTKEDRPTTSTSQKAAKSPATPNNAGSSTVGGGIGGRLRADLAPAD